MEGEKITRGHKLEEGNSEQVDRPKILIDKNRCMQDLKQENNYLTTHGPIQITDLYQVSYICNKQFPQNWIGKHKNTAQQTGQQTNRTTNL